MMQETRSETEVSSLLTTRVKEATQTVSGSKTLMKIVTSIGLSALTHSRKLFSKECYNFYTIGGKMVPYIKNDSICPYSNEFCKLIESIRDILDRGYLDRILINIYKNSEDPSTLIESYEYVYSYHEQMFQHEESSRISGKSKKYDSTFLVKRILEFRDRTLVMCDGKKELSKNWEMVVYVNYNENAPDDYCGDGFDPCDNIPKVDKRLRMLMGNIKTPFHTLRVSDYSNGNCYEGGKLISLVGNNMNVEEKVNDEDINQCSQKTVNNLFDDTTLFQEEKVIKLKKAKNLSLKKTHLSDSEDDEGSNISCPCARHFTSSIFNIVVCRSCCKPQHAECFGLLIKGKNENFKHYCDICAASNSNILCSDSQMTKMSAAERKWLSLLRTTLASFYYYREIDESLIASVQQVSARMAEKLFRYAIKLGVFQLRNDLENQNCTTKIVDSQALEKIISKYFTKVILNTLSPVRRMEPLNLEDEIVFTPNVFSQSSGFNRNVESPLDRSNQNLINALPQENKQLPCSLDYSLSKVQDASPNLKNIDSMDNLPGDDDEGITVRRSSRVKSACKRYQRELFEDSPVKKKHRGGRRLFKEN